MALACTRFSSNFNSCNSFSMRALISRQKLIGSQLPKEELSLPRSGKVWSFGADPFLVAVEFCSEPAIGLEEREPPGQRYSRSRSEVLDYHLPSTRHLRRITIACHPVKAQSVENSLARTRAPRSLGRGSAAEDAKSERAPRCRNRFCALAIYNFVNLNSVVYMFRRKFNRRSVRRKPIFSYKKASNRLLTGNENSGSIFLSHT
jgi:hypothetical protein